MKNSKYLWLNINKKGETEQCRFLIEKYRLKFVHLSSIIIVFMNSLDQHIQSLRNNLSSLMEGVHTHQQMKSVVTLAHAFSVALLKRKFSSGRLNLALVDLNINDIGYDCIAELFRMDDDLVAVQLKAYFGSLPFSQLSDVQLLDQFRRLVFSKVNHGIFRIYAEHDASLGKILRNIKLAVQSLGNFIETDRFGETYLVPASLAPHFELPIKPMDELGGVLREHLHGNERIPDVLAKLSLCLHEETQYAKAVSLVGFAILLRGIFSEDIPIPQSHQQHSMETEDLKKLIIRTSQKIKNEMHERYVLKQKINHADYGKLFLVIEKNLSAIVIQNDGVDFSLFDHLKKEIPGLTKELYRRKYKAIIEYLLSLTKKELGKALQRQL